MKKAVIDLGTNTFNLLIAEVRNGELITLFKTKEAVLLGMGGINEGLLADDAIERAMNTLANFVQFTNEHGILPKDIKAFGTSALRVATNAQELVNRVRKTYGFSIEIISGDEEATLIYQGVKWSYDFETPAVIMDVGGGSTEFILANQNGVSNKISLDIGVSRIFQRLNKPEIYTSEDMKSISRTMDSIEQGQLSGFQCDVLIGSSGSFETFYEMFHEDGFVPRHQIVELDFDKLQEQLDWAMTSSLTDRMNNPLIVSIRKKMLPIAALQIKWAIKKMGVKRMLLSSYSLKEGAC